MANDGSPMRVSYGEYVYEHVPGWAPLPDGWEWNHVVGVGVDSQDNIYAYNRSAHPMIVLDKGGSIQATWGEDVFTTAHHLFVGPDDTLYTTDIGDDTVRKWSSKGEQLLMLGTPNEPAEPFSGNPFNKPTDVALGHDGSIYVTDGYGNARVHQFTPDGSLIRSWGERGSGPGQFQIPHSICVDDTGLVYVADRENSRIQVFQADGQYLREWGGVHRPDHILQGADGRFYVAELGWRQGLSPTQPTPNAISHPSGVKILNSEGGWLGGWGMSTDTPGDIIAGHALAIDSEGSIYVGETLDGARLQKYIRVR